MLFSLATVNAAFGWTFLTKNLNSNTHNIPITTTYQHTNSNTKPSMTIPIYLEV